MTKDPLEELYRKPDPTLADGQNYNVNKFPKELLGCQIEDIDYYYRNKKVNMSHLLGTVPSEDMIQAMILSLKLIIVLLKAWKGTEDGPLNNSVISKEEF